MCYFAFRDCRLRSYGKTPDRHTGEKNVHAALKAWYARPGDELEVEVDGFHIDIVRGQLLVEIQTSNFSSQRRKLEILIERHPLRLVFPIALEKWITRIARME